MRGFRRLLSGNTNIPANTRSRSPERFLRTSFENLTLDGSQSRSLSSSSGQPPDRPGPSRPPTTDLVNQAARSRPQTPTRLELFGGDDPIDVLSKEPRLEDDNTVLTTVVKERCRESSQGWDVTSCPAEDLVPPKKIDHPGAGRYIGTELKGKPKWLWDSHKKSTVRSTDDMFDDGFVAVSYTWGRWREDWRKISGTPWLVPSIQKHNPDYPNMVCNFDIEQLMDVLCRMKHVRYFWIDVLCIPQNPQTPEEKQEKDTEIAKQGAIFKDANGVVVYLWSIDEGKEFAAGINELSNLVRWYWQTTFSKHADAKNKQRGPKTCFDKFAPRLRNDPWFSSLWTLQEMVLTPASVWIARDGSHCKVDGKVMTTQTIADKFFDFVLREKFEDPLGCASFDPSRNLALLNLPKSEQSNAALLRSWIDWAFQETSIPTCVFESRGGVLLATFQRRYSKRRELAILAALMVGNDKDYDKDPIVIAGLPLSLWNDLIQLDGGRLFDNIHSSSGPLTDMLPTTADTMCFFHGLRNPCKNWELKGNGELKIGQGSSICYFSKRKKTEYSFPDQRIYGGDPETTVKKYLSGKGIKAKHVRFVEIGLQTPYFMQTFTAVRGVILVTESKHLQNDACRWYKAGMFSSRDFGKDVLGHDIIVGAPKKIIST